MNELKPEDVMRALEQCANDESCIGCGWQGHSDGCIDALMRDAIALLHEKDADIKMLSEQNLALGEVILKKDEEIERWKAENDHLVKEAVFAPMERANCTLAARAEALTEFFERVCKEVEQTPNANEFFINSWKAKLAEIEKELKGETDGKTDL